MARVGSGQHRLVIFEMALASTSTDVNLHHNGCTVLPELSRLANARQALAPS